MPRSLSPEILTNIISFVHGDPSPETKSNLGNCTLVSRTFCNIVKPLRFSNVTIKVVEPDDEVQVRMYDFMESALPLENSTCTGIVQHVRSFKLVLNLCNDYGELIRSEELDEDLSGVMNRFNTTHGRLHGFTLKGVERRMGWEWMGQSPRDALQQLIQSPHLRALRLEHIVRVPAKLFNGTAFEELYLDTEIADYTPKQGGGDEDESEGEDGEEDEEEENDKEGGSASSPTQIISSLPLSRLVTLGVRLNSEKDVIQTDAFLAAVPSLRSLELTIGKEFPFSSCPKLSKVASLQQLIIGNDTTENDVIGALLASANDVIKLLQLLGSGSGPLTIPTLVLRASFWGCALFNRFARTPPPKTVTDPQPLDKILAGDMLAEVGHLRFSVSVGAGRERPPSLGWLEEIRGEASAPTSSL